MYRILLCRAFIVVPILIILVCTSVILLARWAKEKNISLKSIAVTLSVVTLTILLSYFAFLHGNLRKPVVDLEDCMQSFDALVNLNAEKQENPYFACKNGEHYLATIENDNLEMEIHIVYGEMDSDFEITNTNANNFETVFAPLFTVEKEVGDVTCTASPMYAGTEEAFFVRAFNGSYSGSIFMRKNDVNIVIDYRISNGIHPINCFTNVRPAQGWVVISEQLSKG